METSGTGADKLSGRSWTNVGSSRCGVRPAGTCACRWPLPTLLHSAIFSLAGWSGCRLRVDRSRGRNLVFPTLGPARHHDGNEKRCIPSAR